MSLLRSLRRLRHWRQDLCQYKSGWCEVWLQAPCLRRCSRLPKAVVCRNSPVIKSNTSCRAFAWSRLTSTFSCLLVRYPCRGFAPLLILSTSDEILAIEARQVHCLCTFSVEGCLLAKSSSVLVLDRKLVRRLGCAAPEHSVACFVAVPEFELAVLRGGKLRASI